MTREFVFFIQSQYYYIITAYYIQCKNSQKYLKENVIERERAKKGRKISLMKKRF